MPNYALRCPNGHEAVYRMSYEEFDQYRNGESRFYCDCQERMQVKIEKTPRVYVLDKHMTISNQTLGAKGNRRMV